ncbi:GTPase-associated system all-helical protein GASH [Rubripirellula reticaptiva]|uniref:GTPase-associated system helical domain-containing protein n=1 Tax=Rubripirellula reticaptiva TaxID=2528013 RepID=A0A5C6F824_9BACT|nr:GTPase-associated system all-helical protein GASH [Rubripirellula reticaptiva]TWU55929.1 hypothetical protein Poly59_22320 [Rubripirellula reticaptiva]
MENFIREYLRDGLIEVGDSEDHLKTLNESAESLSSVFANDLPALVRFIRATLVPSVDGESPALVNISEKVEVSWPTFVGVGPERKIPMLVAVGWQAVFEGINEDADILALVWYASVNAITRGEIDERVRPVVGHVQELGKRVEQRACDEWRSTIEKPRKYVSSIAVPEVKNTINKALLCATTGTGTDGNALENGNTNTMDNSGPWGQHFAKQASSAITAAISSQQSAVITSVEKVTGDLSKKFNVIREEAVRSHQAQNARTELLWLAESAYSPRFGCGYSELKGKEAAAALAVDIAEVAMGAAPLSVEHFLAVQTQKFVSGAEVKVETFVKELAKAEFFALLPESLTTPLDTTSPLGLFEAAGELQRQTLKAPQVSKRIGYAKATTMPVGELARIMFREIKCAEFMGAELWA